MLPREKLLRLGGEALSLEEGLAVLLGTGPRRTQINDDSPTLACMDLATTLLNRISPLGESENRARAFFEAMDVRTPSFIHDLRGLGPTGRARILAALEIARRYRAFHHATPPLQPSGEGDLKARCIASIPWETRSSSREWLGFVPLYRKLDQINLGTFCRIADGTRLTVNFDPVDLFAAVLPLRPHGIFLLHNHPSGALTPSRGDIDLTQKVADVCGRLNLRLQGHAIVTAQDSSWIL